MKKRTRTILLLLLFKFAFYQNVQAEDQIFTKNIGKNDTKIEATGEVITSLSKEESFVKILDENMEYYGGNQAWYDSKLGSESGCGAVAAANILAYLSINKEEARNLYSYDASSITKEEFIKYMEEVFQFVKPVQVPFWGYQSIGIPSTLLLSNNIKAFAKERGIIIEDHRLRKEPSTASADEIKSFIKEGLKGDNPVALLEWNNENREYELHWMTITSLKENTETKETEITVSTWGQKRILKFQELWSEDLVTNFGDLVYFTVGENK